VQVNRYGARLIGDDTDRRGPRDVVAPFRLFDRDRELPFWEQPLQQAAYTGRAVPISEGRLVRRDGSSVDVMMSAAPLFDERGVPRGAIAAIVDISERKKAEARQSRLLGELRHRVKNILAVVVSLAARMSSNGAPLEHFVPAFEGRLMAMGRMQELLAKDMWTRVGLGELAMAALAPYGASADDKIVIGGPGVWLPPDTAAALGMILHELATNAAKYGALSVPAGRVELSWRISDEDEGKQVLLFWTERNGPHIDAPPKMGFGSRLIVQMMEYELGGQAQLSFLPEGLRCVSNFPVVDNRP
jgi:two-component system, chemotaxis family, CheB/CheR fusion protein